MLQNSLEDHKKRIYKMRQEEALKRQIADFLLTKKFLFPIAIHRISIESRNISIFVKFINISKEQEEELKIYLEREIKNKFKRMKRCFFIDTF